MGDDGGSYMGTRGQKRLLGIAGSGHIEQRKGRGSLPIGSVHCRERGIGYRDVKRVGVSSFTELPAGLHAPLPRILAASDEIQVLPHEAEYRAGVALLTEAEKAGMS